MAEYLARIGTSGGEIQERSFVADSEETLRRDLDAKGFYVFSVRARGAGLGGLRLARRRNRIKTREFLVFNHEFATLLKAGLPVLQGLDLLLERMENPTFRDVLREIRDQVKGGASLSDAFGSFPQHFPALYATSLRAGERSGELEHVIRRYITYTQVVEDVRKKVGQAVVYPAILITFSLTAVYVLLTFAIPRFAEMFQTFGKELPWITAFLIAISKVLNRHWEVMLAGLIGAVVGLRLWWGSASGRSRLDRIKLRLPFVGSIWRKFAVSQLTRALATLLRGGIPLVSALDVAADSVGNRVIASRSRAVVRNVREGESLSAALEKTGVLQPMVIEMVKVGESTGALSEMLENVADYYDEDISHDLQRLLTILEPALLIFMGLVIGSMLVAMYLPVFQLQSVAG